MYTDSQIERESFYQHFHLKYLERRLKQSFKIGRGSISFCHLHLQPTLEKKKIKKQIPSERSEEEPKPETYDGSPYTSHHPLNRAKAENIHHRGKYHCTTDLLFDCFRFDQTSKTVVHSAQAAKQLNTNKINRR